MNLPTSENAKRLSKLYNRRLSTEWSEKEVRVFRNLRINETDLSLIEAYYKAERRKHEIWLYSGRGSCGIHRRDLQTLLNNWSGELDRARQWQSSAKRIHGRNGERKEVRPYREISDAELEKNKAECARLKTELAEKLKMT